MYSVILWILLVVTFILALIATLRKRQSERLQAEKYSLTTTIIALTALIIGELWGDNLKGSIWFEAKTEGYISQPSAQDLKLRKNGTFTVYLGETDFACYYTGNYKKVNDTLIFDEETVSKTNAKMTTLYLINDKQLLPLVDTTKDINQYTKFDIITTK